MNLQARKLNVIEYLIAILDEKTFTKIEETIDLLKSQSSPKPFTQKQLFERAKKSNEDYLAGKFKTQQQLESPSENW